jgi:hypothetical protein
MLITEPPVPNTKSCRYKSVGILTARVGLVFQVRKDVDYALRTVVLVGVLSHSVAATQAVIHTGNSRRGRRNVA